MRVILAFFILLFSLLFSFLNHNYYKWFCLPSIYNNYALSVVNATSLLINESGIYLLPLPTHIFEHSCLLVCQLVCYPLLLVSIQGLLFALLYP